MNSDEIVQAQRRLRSTLFNGRRAGGLAGSSDLAAHLLLYLDDTERCWELTLDWLCHTLDADRVDGGYLHPGRGSYRPVAESVRDGLQIPTSVDTVFDVNESGVRCVWNAPQAVVFESIERDARFTQPARSQLLSLDTRSKLAVTLRDGAIPIGMICCDWTRERRRWSGAQCGEFSEFATGVLSPIFAAAGGARAEAGALAAKDAVLTPGELSVARLAVQGMSYKEIARQLNRSFSTVDHRLRSIRDKLGASSTARMICLLSDLLSRQYPE